MTTGNTYQIHTMQDLLQLDERQLDDCLIDVKAWWSFRKSFDEKVQFGKDILKQLGMSDKDIEASVNQPPGFQWVDDGTRTGKLRVEAIVTDENGNKMVEENMSFEVNDKGEVVL